jgi:hypothetical protein
MKVVIEVQPRQELIDSEQRLLEAITQSLKDAYGNNMVGYPTVILKRFQDYSWLIWSIQQLCEQVNELRDQLYETKAEQGYGSLGNAYVIQAVEGFGREHLMNTTPANFKPMRLSDWIEQGENDHNA